ncbi:MAG: hypothetical protein PHR28_14110 [candidate division Zixibacteria bacterium]|jgi:sugar-specific transcriptional regulator TrmB|nr:hypothetical protein [candidate division Zixibacteria bacterium]
MVTDNQETINVESVVVEEPVSDVIDIDIIDGHDEPERFVDESRKDWRRRLKMWQHDQKEQKLRKEQDNNFSEELVREVAEMIKADNDTWCFMDTELLMEFIRLAIRQCVKDEGGIKAFKDGVADKEELKQKIKAAFDASPKSKEITADQVMRINVAYNQGKQLGNIPRKFIRKLLKKAT